MKISLNDWNRYKSALASLSQAAADEFRDHFLKNNPNGLAAVSREDVIQYAYALITKYGEGSAALACQMYDAIAELEGALVPLAEPAATATLNETAKAINGSFIQSESGQLVESTIQRLVKQAGADTTLKNAIRDKAQFAWIPSGDTCSFCIVLASRGWQYASSKSLRNGHAEHIHAHCDCQYAIRFSDKLDVSGYDPQKYYDEYNDAADGKPKDKINAMRRKNYAENREKILEQKRIAYAKRKGNEEVL